MKQIDFLKLIEIARVDNGFIPANSNAIKIHENLQEGEIAVFKTANSRDLKFHQNYFVFLNFIYDLLPQKFKKEVKKKNFYIFLKYAKNEIEILFTFKNGLQIIQPISISFSNFDELQFRNYIKDQLPFIYSEIIDKLFNEHEAKDVIELIENEFEKFFGVLEKTI